MNMEMPVIHKRAPSDDLESLSARYGVPVCMIARANGIRTTADIERLSRIRIPRPCYCNRSEKETDCRTVTVTAEDTLFDIARRYGVTAGIILRANGIGDPESICEGDILRIPVLSGTIVSVREGETIEDIAQKHGTSASRIRRINMLEPDEPVFAGMRLLVDSFE